MPFINAAIYVRVSSEEQVKHGYSIGAQLEKCRERALSLGVKNIIEFRDEGVSGSILQRPGLMKLRESIRSGGIDLVVVYDPDRFARNVSHQLIITEEIDNKGVRLEFVNFDWKNTPEGQMFYTIRGAISQYEREKIRERTMIGRIQKAKKGKMPHGHKPYGYNYDSESATLVINDKEAEVVKFMFNWIINEDIGINGIAKRLTAMGVPTKRGAKQWHRTVVKQILSNPVYKGVFYANRYNCKDYGLNKYKAPEDKVCFTLRDESEWIPVPVPRIIDDDTWERAQKVLENARRLWAGLNKKKYLLSGLVTCGECGDNMSGVYGKHWGKKYRYYTCRKNWAGSSSKGCGQRFNADILESAVWEVITNWLKDPEQLLEVMEENPDRKILEKELLNLENEIDKCNQGRAGIISMLEKSIIKQDEAVLSFTRIEKQKKDLETRINEIKLSLNKGQINDSERKVWLEMAKGYLESLERMDFNDRRALVRQLISRVIVFSDKNIIVHGNISSL
ncbi:recombinase family protein [Desulfolucanica intricata]|uniref:recombinase family protein n=1 Tax=Desulfolucanica intricata TaxID=1285191 RepID=UPI0008319D10|nr:recombinase family protein [Desulfolucanica intricata]